MRLPLRFQANLGLFNLFNQDFIKTLYATRCYRQDCYSIQKVENQITIPLELKRKQDTMLIKVVALKKSSRLSQELFKKD